MQNKVDQNLLTEQEKYGMKSVKLAIFSVAQLTYCMQTVENEYIPLQERLNESG